MHQIKKILFFISFTTIIFNSCIEEYIPKLDTSESKKIVVYGILTDQEGIHQVNISQVSSINNPQIIPITGCTVKLTNINGVSILYTESDKGKYEALIPQSYLSIDNSYKIDITTSNGINIVSDFEKMYECPKVDSIYYIKEDKPTSNIDINIEGIQFYLDFDATNLNTHYFKFDIEETWEYHAAYPIEYYFDGVVRRIYPPDYSNNVCWDTENINNKFILNTSNLEFNKYKKLPLHFVDNKTARLAHTYSILVKQYSLDEKSFTFWEEVSINNLSDASLYETQPFPVKGNLHNLTNPDQIVLGFFQVSAVKTKRIFISGVEELIVDYNQFCSPYSIRKPFEQEFTPDQYPIYFSDKGILDNECIFCNMNGGTTKKPEFWPY